LQQQGVPYGVAHHVAALPPVSSLFAAVLVVNPLQHLLAPSGVLSSLSAAQQQALMGREFFPNLISGPFHDGLVVVFAVAAGLAALAAVASLLRGGRVACHARQDIVAGFGLSDALGELRENFVRSGPPPAHESVGDPLHQFADRLEPHRHDRRGQD
jgi:type IV secretory pathway VirB2 component (pilin)